jgi:outer membrane protein OmpA-like peptidoglycan-associated protein
MKLPDRSARAVRRPRRRPVPTMLLLGAMACLLLPAAPAAAQSADGKSGVDIDFGALDALPKSKPEATPNRKAPPARKPHKSEAKAAALPAPAPAPPAPDLAPPVAPSAPAAAAVSPPRPPTVASPAVPKPAPVPPPPAPVAAVSPPPPPPSAAPHAVARIGSIAFAGDASELSADAKRSLDELVQRMQRDERLHLMLNGYAASGGDASRTRRTSLARALAVRAYLVDRGIAPMRVDVRAVGDRGEGDAPPDRVDLMTSERQPP